MLSKIDLTGTRGRTDLKQYRLLSFASGFEVLLVSTKCLVEKQKSENPLAAAALCVEAGSFADPQEAQGIAHFLEHMIFMGSERYPDENAYDSFVSSHGGSCNAMTEGEYTVYQFVGTSEPTAFAKTLDIFAQCLQAPLLTASCSDREINAIESEFSLARTEDESRVAQLYCSSCDNTRGGEAAAVPAAKKLSAMKLNDSNQGGKSSKKSSSKKGSSSSTACAANEALIAETLAAYCPERDHVLKKFSWGNLRSLKTVPEAVFGAEVHALLRKWYAEHYTPDRMSMVLVSPLGFEQLEEMVLQSFGKWTGGADEQLPATEPEKAEQAGIKRLRMSPAPEIAAASLAPGAKLLCASSMLSEAAAGAPRPTPRFPPLHEVDTSPFPYRQVDLTAVDKSMKPALSPLKLVRVIPIKKLHKLMLKFQMPSILPFFRQKIESYYGHLLGHEGKGSILSALKNLQLGTSLYAGISSEGQSVNSMFSVFEIGVTLTNTGVANWPYIVSTIFEYIRELRSLGPQRWVFEELGCMADIEFDNLDEEDEEEYAESMAIEMSNVLGVGRGLRRGGSGVSGVDMKEHLQTRSELVQAAYKYWEYDAANVTNFLSYFVPENMRVELVSSHFRDNDSENDDDSEDDDDDSEDDDDDSEDDEDDDMDDEDSDDDDEDKDAVDLVELFEGPEEWLSVVESPFHSEQHVQPAAPSSKKSSSGSGRGKAVQARNSTPPSPRAPRKEIHFGTEYWEDRIPASIVLMWQRILALSSTDGGGAFGDNKNSQIPAKYFCAAESRGAIASAQQLHLPARNEYIPSDLSIVPTESVQYDATMQPSTRSVLSHVISQALDSFDTPVDRSITQRAPKLVFKGSCTEPNVCSGSGTGFQAWHYLNPLYNHLPKLDVRLVLYSSYICTSPLTTALTELLCKVITAYLTESTLYIAAICGLDGTIRAFEGCGIEVKVAGYSSEKAFVLLYKLLDALLFPEKYCCSTSSSSSDASGAATAASDVTVASNIILAQYDMITRSYANKNTTASDASSNARLDLLDAMHFHADDKLQALQEAVQQQSHESRKNGGGDAHASAEPSPVVLKKLLADHVKSILLACAAQLFIHGNCSATRATAQSEEVFNKLMQRCLQISAGAQTSVSGKGKKGKTLRPLVAWDHYPVRCITRLDTLKVPASLPSSASNGTVPGSKKGTSSKKAASSGALGLSSSSVFQHHYYRYDLAPSNSTEDNVSVEVYYQLPLPEGGLFAAERVGEEPQCAPEATAYFRELVLITLLEEVLSEPFFDSLRTQQQLGYSVRCGHRDTFGVLGFIFNVVSSAYSIEVIEKSLFDFINNKICFELLPNMPSELFERYVLALIRKMSNKAEPSLFSAGNSLWRHIAERSYGFVLNDAIAAFLTNTYGFCSVVDEGNSDSAGAAQAKGGDSNQREGATKNRGVEQLKVDLLSFAKRLFHLQAPSTGLAARQSAQNVLIVRAFNEDVNRSKKSSLDFGSGAALAAKGAPRSTSSGRETSADDRGDACGHAGDRRKAGGQPGALGRAGGRHVCNCNERRAAARAAAATKGTPGVDAADVDAIFCEVCSVVVVFPAVAVTEHAISKTQKSSRVGFGVFPSLV